MLHRVYILVVAGMVLFGGAATYYWVQFEDARRARPQASHNIFQVLDKSCKEKYGASYSFRTNRCCDGAASDLCEPL
jgi:hypothetical protein